MSIEYQNYWSQGRGMQIAMPDRFFLLDLPKEHPLELILSGYQRNNRFKMQQRMANFVKDVEIPFIKKMVEMGFKINHSALDSWGESWMKTLKS